MTKIVINTCYGGFGLSEEAFAQFREIKGLGVQYDFDGDIPRDDPVLIQIVEQLGQRSHGDYAKLKVVEIPDDVKWHIGEYDGCEWVAENHRTWD